jgi:putative transposase
MARPLRLDAPGCWHHVFLRGARKAPIFADDVDCLAFLDLLGTASERYGLEVHAYSLMPNHYHLLLRSQRGLLSKGMQFLNGMFTKHLNARHQGWDGPVFRGRFRSKRVVREDYLVTLLAYIHLNPVAARLVKRPEEQCWTSHRAYMGLDEAQPWLRVGELLDLHGGREVLAERVLRIRRGADPWPANREVDMAAFWVDREPAPPLEPGESRSRSASVEEILGRVCTFTGVERAQLEEPVRGRRGNQPRRFAIWALARETDLTHAAIATVFGMSTPHVSQVLAGTRRAEPPPEIAAWIASWEGGEKLIS